MASKKDKFKKAIKSHIDGSAEGEKPGMQGFVEDMSRSSRKAEEEPAAVEPAVEPEVESQVQPKSEERAAPTASAPEAAAEKSAESAKPAEPASSVAAEKPAPETPPKAPAAAPKKIPPPGEKQPDKSENLISARRTPVETVPERASERLSSSSGATPRKRPTMARTRDSVYNVSSDIRLEDYTDTSSEGGGGVGAALRIGAGLVLLIVLLYGIYTAGGLLFAPSYTLAVSSTPLTAANAVEFAAAERVSTAAGQPVYIHFQWQEGELKTDYVKIQVDRISAGGSEVEEAILARRPPITANYIQFAGPLEVGKYRITVTDRGGRRLADRVVNVN